MIDDRRPLLLGSGSPRRREILTTLGLPLRVLPAVVDESALPGEGPVDYLSRIADNKLKAVAALEAARDAGAILVADTTVIVEGRILGKPADLAEARAMLRALSGRAHQVSTRFAIASPDEPARAIHAETVSSTVIFRPLEGDEIDAYAATGEGLDKAGGYAIQGIGAFAVARVEGSYANIVGLPVCEVILALRATGLLPRFPVERARAA